MQGWIGIPLAPLSSWKGNLHVCKVLVFLETKNCKGFSQGVGHVMCEDNFQFILDKVLINLGLRFTANVTKDSKIGE
jgi:hypothetical protein